MGLRGQRHAPAALPPGKSPGTHFIGGWVGPRAGLDGCGKSRPPPPGFDPRTVQPIASRCTDRAIPDHLFVLVKNKKTTDTEIKCHVWQIENEDAWDLCFARHGCTIGNNAGILIGH